MVDNHNDGIVTITVTKRILSQIDPYEGRLEVSFENLSYKPFMCTNWNGSPDAMTNERMSATGLVKMRKPDGGLARRSARKVCGPSPPVSSALTSKASMMIRIGPTVRTSLSVCRNKDSKKRMIVCAA